MYSVPMLANYCQALGVLVVPNGWYQTDAPYLRDKISNYVPIGFSSDDDVCKCEISRHFG